jgi:hypothetical protein
MGPFGAQGLALLLARFHEVLIQHVTKAKQPTGRNAVAGKIADLSIEDSAVTLARLNRDAPSTFDPYGGALKPKPPPRKKDLRKLGQWIEAKRKAEELKAKELALAFEAERGNLKKS